MLLNFLEILIKQVKSGEKVIVQKGFAFRVVSTSVYTEV